MKVLKILLIAVVLALPSMPAMGDELLLPGGSGQGVTHPEMYYIGVHRPDGSCETVRVLADNVEQAMQTAKKDCDICVTDDLTDLFRNMTPARRLQVARTCPRF
ncbi:MAG: hypothetical protein WA666_10305 [Nitrospirota bacterium]